MRTRHLFLALCLVGLTLPNAAFWPWLGAHGFAPRQFISDLFANGVSSFFGLDVVVAALALIIFVELEGRRLGIRRRWLPIAATCLVGVSFGLPVFLYQRQAHLDRLRRQ
jgi:hypothetical protein